MQITFMFFVLILKLYFAFCFFFVLLFNRFTMSQFSICSFTVLFSLLRSNLKLETLLKRITVATSPPAVHALVLHSPCCPAVAVTDFGRWEADDVD